MRLGLWFVAGTVGLLGWLGMGCAPDGRGSVGDAAVDFWGPDGDAGVAVECGRIVDFGIPDPTNCAMGGGELLYAMSTLWFGEPDPTRPNLGTPGFNLDNLGGPCGPCGHADFVYDVDGDGTLDPGIDNQVAALGPDPFDPPPPHPVPGDSILLVQIEDVDDVGDPSGDPCVTVNLLYTELPDSVDTSCGADGDTLCPDQAFTIDPASYDSTSGAPLMSVQATVTYDGRILARPLDITIRSEVGDQPYDFLLERGAVAFDVRPQALSNGILGGGIGVDALVATVLSLQGQSVEESTIRGLLEPQADLDPEPDPDGGPPVCQAISAGLVFDGVPAVAAQGGL